MLALGPYLALLSMQVGSSTSAPSGALGTFGEQPFSVEADRLTAHPKARVFTATGRVVLRRSDLTVFADSVRFDDARRLGVAEGRVTVVEGKSVMRCSRVALRFPEATGRLNRVHLRIKADLPPDVVERLAASELFLYGRDEVIVVADRIDRVGQRRLEVEDVSLTSCDCGEGRPPSWTIEALSADVDLDSGAWLFLPRFHVTVPLSVDDRAEFVLRAPDDIRATEGGRKLSSLGPSSGPSASAASSHVSVPILALPLLYVPLGDRRSGLLVPRPSFAKQTGYAVEQPLFLTFGPSYDATLAASYLSWRGPAGSLEFRWAPTESTSGQVEAKVVLDRGEIVAQRPGDPASARFAKVRDAPIVRFAIGGRHASRLDHGTLVADVALLGDPAYLSEFADEFLARQSEVSRSRVTYHLIHDSNVRVALGAQLLEDLRGRSYPLVEGGQRQLRETQIFSDERSGAGEIRYRLVDFRIDAPVSRVTDVGPVYGGARLSAQVFSAPRPDVARFVRADMRPEVAMPIDLFGLATFEPSVAVRMTAWQGREAGTNVMATRAAMVGGARLRTEMTRRFEHVVHRIAPELDYRIIPWMGVSGEQGRLATNDEIDLLGKAHQVRLRLVSDLWDATDGRRLGGLEAWIGRELGLSPGGPETSDAVLDLDLEIAGREWPVSLGLEGRMAVGAPAGAPRVSEAALGLRLTSRGGDEIRLLAGRFDDEIPRSMIIAPEEITPSSTLDRSRYVSLTEYRGSSPEDRMSLLPWAALRGLSATFRTNSLRPLLLSGGATLTLSDVAPQLEYYGRVSRIRDAYGLVGWASSCRCWSLAVTGRYAVDTGFSIQVLLDLAQLGSVGTPTL